MNKRFFGGLATAAMLAGGIAFSTSGAASAVADQETDNVCYGTEQFQEFKYKRTVTTPAVEEVSHVEYLYEKEVRTETFKTQHEIDKYVRDRTREYVPEVEEIPSKWWVWSPNKDQGPFDGPPAFPSDPRGTWQGPKINGGPDQNTFGTFNASNGNSGRSSWFHRTEGVAGSDGYYTDWTDWSAPYRWEPIGSHLAWVDVVPAPNWKADGTQTDTYQRQWTEYPTGNTKQVSTGFTTETVSSGWVKDKLGEPWELGDTKKVIDVEAVPESTEIFYYTGEGDGSTKKGDAIWTEETSIEGWTQFKDRDSERQVEVDCPTKDDEITYGDWTGEPECDKTTYDQTRTVTTISYTWDESIKDFVAREPVVTPETRKVHVEKVEPCPTTQPPQPPTTTQPPTPQPPAPQLPTVLPTSDVAVLPPAQAPTSTAPAPAVTTPAAGLPATGSNATGVTALIALLVTSLGGAAVHLSRQRNVTS